MLATSSTLQNAWLTADSVTKMLSQRYAFDDIGGLKESQVNKAIEAYYPGIESPQNDTGVFRVKHTIRLEGQGKLDATFYYVTNPGGSMQPYPSNMAKEEWVKFYLEAKAIGEYRTDQPTTAKCLKSWDNVDCKIHDYKAAYFSSSIAVEGSLPQHEQTHVIASDYWESTEAKNLFKPSANESVEDALDRRIELCEKVLGSANGYKMVLPGDDDPGSV